MIKLIRRIFLLFLICYLGVSSIFGQTPSKGNDDNNPPTIRPLKLGDTIPDVLWNMPLSVTNLRSGKQTIKLKDHRGEKLTIIDFWATWCSPCIKGMPKLDSIVKSDNRIAALSVGAEDRRKIENFLSNKPLTYKTGFDLPVVVEDTQLKMFFPHARIPHYVWIDANGRVMAFTSSEALSDDNIKKALETRQVTAEMKIDYDKSGPLYVKDKRLPEWGDLQYFSLLSKGYKEGMGSSNRQRILNDKVVGNLFTNSSIYKIFSFLINQIDPDNFKNDYEYQVQDIEELLVTSKSERELEWKKKHFYSFDYWNLNHSVGTLYLDMINALNIASPYTLIISKKMKTCYVLEDIKTNANGPIDEDKDASDFIFDVKSTTRHLTVYLTNNASLNLDIINRSESTSLFRYALKNSKGFTQINKRLKQYGLKLSKRDVMVNHYLFKEKGGGL